MSAKRPLFHDGLQKTAENTDICSEDDLWVPKKGLEGGLQSTLAGIFSSKKVRQPVILGTRRKRERELQYLWYCWCSYYTVVVSILTQNGLLALLCY